MKAGSKFWIIAGLMICLGILQLSCTREQKTIEVCVFPGIEVEACSVNGKECSCEKAIVECRQAAASGTVSNMRINFLDKREQKGDDELLEQLRKIATDAGIVPEVVVATSDILDVE